VEWGSQDPTALHDFKHKVLQAAVAIGHFLNYGDFGVNAFTDGTGPTSFEYIQEQIDIAAYVVSKFFEGVDFDFPGFDCPLHEKDLGAFELIGGKLKELIELVF